MIVSLRPCRDDATRQNCSDHDHSSRCAWFIQPGEQKRNGQGSHSR